MRFCIVFMKFAFFVRFYGVSYFLRYQIPSAFLHCFYEVCIFVLFYEVCIFYGMKFLVRFWVVFTQFVFSLRLVGTTVSALASLALFSRRAVGTTVSALAWLAKLLWRLWLALPSGRSLRSRHCSRDLACTTASALASLATTRGRRTHLCALQERFVAVLYV